MFVYRYLLFGKKIFTADKVERFCFLCKKKTISLKTSSVICLHIKTDCIAKNYYLTQQPPKWVIKIRDGNLILTALTTGRVLLINATKSLGFVLPQVVLTLEWASANFQPWKILNTIEIVLNSEIFSEFDALSFMFNIFTTHFGGWLVASLICLNVTVWYSYESYMSVIIWLCDHAMRFQSKAYISPLLTIESQ